MTCVREMLLHCVTQDFTVRYFHYDGALRIVKLFIKEINGCWLLSIHCLIMMYDIDIHISTEQLVSKGMFKMEVLCQ